ncbi:flagellar biosynthesis protein FliQ [Rhodocaloribacter litoris]|uniref:flagellar biosynthesis protein FliQ n=1 Tax=Rhodocaloribacter litoris TaxID=2558931 RepID=UPI00141D9396|nr:flagellar biosynthesis protein FliQ [Rhodocaloribacter litoris]QXD16065.1 flagellar biosynthesis protein FliQ [Rhodocaloribacter litoris]GIV59797.1 MAG: flagellar biosynthetic protein FliQ [Rhodothermaceae bacterium]
MNTDVALYWAQEAMRLALMLTLPLLGAALLVGLVVSLLQAVTSIQEMTLSYVPKMLIVGFILLFLAPWMVQMLIDFTVNVFAFIPSVSQ